MDSLIYRTRTHYRISPALVFLAAVILGLSMMATAVWIALTQPHVDLPEGAVPTRIGGFVLLPSDLMEEPDQLGSFDAIRAFYTRQTLLRAELEGEFVDVVYGLPDGTSHSQSMPIRPRMISDLPGAFWFQNIVGLISLFFGGWVLGLRREDWGARMFALTAVLVPVFAMAASIYSTRQIALDGTLFRVLSGINIGGAVGFGIALVGLFAMYPKPLFAPRWLWVVGAVFAVPLVMAVSQRGIDNIGALTVLSQMGIALVLGIVQWVRSRREPVNRAGLRWFLMICLLGCSLFIGLVIAPVALGISDQGLISQGYAFGFFNLMHFGLALGVLRFQLFNLDRWSYYIWLWLSGMVMIFVLDLALVRLLQTQPWMSLSVALLVAGFLYFPLRQLLLNLLLNRRAASISGRMGEIVTAALSPTQRQHAQRWDALLQAIFEPLAPPGPIIGPLAEQISHPAIAESGLDLLIPDVAGLGPRRLRYAKQGRRLFTPADLEIAANLVQMHTLATQSRHSYERGVILERDRISRDIHDNIGAQLLSALHSREPNRKDDLLRESLTDLRAIINDGFTAAYPLDDLLADLRTETADRLESNAIVLNWNAPEPTAGHTPPTVPFTLANGIRSVLREAVSNVVRHAGACVVDIEITRDATGISLFICDNGTGLPDSAVRTVPQGGTVPAGRAVPPVRTAPPGGNGIPNIVERAQALGGTGSVRRRTESQPGTMVTVHLPFTAMTDESDTAALATTTASQSVAS
jgi:signal transduction histidine kinase